MSIEKQLDGIMDLLMPEPEKTRLLPINQFDVYQFVNVQEGDRTQRSTSLGSEYRKFRFSNHARPSRHLRTLIIKGVVAELLIKLSIRTKLGTELQDIDIFGITQLPPQVHLYLKKGSNDM